MLGRVDAVGREAGERLELLPALAGLLQRLRERPLLPAPARLVQRLQLLLLGADQLVELRLAVAAAPLPAGSLAITGLLGSSLGCQILAAVGNVAAMAAACHA